MAATGVPGTRLRSLRETRSMSQASLARTLGISPSYLNQIEHGSRPLTVPVLLRITEVFGVDAAFFAARRPERLVAELHEVFAETTTPAGAVSPTEIERLAAEMPTAADAVLELYRRWRRADEHLAAATDSPRDGSDRVRSASPHEQVRDFFYRRRNHIADLDDAGEDLAAEIGVRRGEVRRALAERLRGRHGVSIAGLDDTDPEGAGELHSYDRTHRVLRLSPTLRPGQQAFRMATQLGFLEQDHVIDALAAEDSGDEATRTLTRIGLARYFASALTLPYGEFRATAEEFRYDVQRLADHFGQGFETICHRLSTLQRPSEPGVPFSFVRVDRAGNMSKRQSASGFHFSRGGGTCPLWNVYHAFTAPGEIHVQVASMPDGARYLWVARTVHGSRRRWGSPGKTFAIALGCELRHAHRLVYSAGLDLDDPAAATPIGAGCRVCSRDACPQRAFPRLDHAPSIQEDRSTFVPYPTG
ncbi:Cro/Cl family transcriptional regulator [Pseudonocardia sp. EC080610-09]|uniref:short-chain fatty acyl-CoA regulator family protein n=1 Tax=unclassified Pseudonocardia TaxID=2619320 RepID=UPI00070695B9|nr:MULTISPECIES: short-chain fatty acyl-CoA regulator family protein [unclassified Pseudonocardia]ALL75278.1 Cro/Cl family transcriptional regulator [Pseudonocardia sp. EC080610-09]ALL82303.1 Cro/Cl family transcriptional regulator [Pseudonocardia sp. EC080619-01]